MIIGIDLGTTNCACAVFRDGKVDMIPNSLGHYLTPSAVSVDDDGRILTGLPARERQSTHSDRTITAFKRYMGTSRVTRLGEHQFTPEELSALIVGSLRRDAEAYLGRPVDEAVITVPAYFNDKQRKATRQAGILAGLKVERLINEPTAAALAYGLHQRDRDTRFLVFDLGGGTFDVSILEIFDGIIEVRASAGDNRLGGEDFNEVLIAMARSEFKSELAGDAAWNQGLYHRIREAAERCRRALTENGEAALTFVWKERSFSMEVSEGTFETACADLISNMREPVLRSLRDGQIPVDRLDEVILVGGATRMPVVRKAVTRMFGRFPSTAVNPDEAVAQGAAVQAALKSRDAALAEVVLTDVCPFTLGVESAQGGRDGRQMVTGVFTPIIERNCVVPVSREEIFHTVFDNQAVVEFPVYQGESRWTKDNILLGSVEVPVPRRRAGEVQVNCRFSYDINGLLEVDVHVPATGQQRQLVVVDKEGLSPEKIEERRAELAKLKIHPRDTDGVRATLARAERCYENSIGEAREFIGGVMLDFERILARQDPRACEAARLELNSILDEFEGHSLL